MMCYNIFRTYYTMTFLWLFYDIIYSHSSWYTILWLFNDILYHDFSWLFITFLTYSIMTFYDFCIYILFYDFLWLFMTYYWLLHCMTFSLQCCFHCEISVQSGILLKKQIELENGNVSTETGFVKEICFFLARLCACSYHSLMSEDAFANAPFFCPFLPWKLNFLKISDMMSYTEKHVITERVGSKGRHTALPNCQDILSMFAFFWMSS